MHQYILYFKQPNVQPLADFNHYGEHLHETIKLLGI